MFASKDSGVFLPADDRYKEFSITFEGNVLQFVLHGRSKSGVANQAIVRLAVNYRGKNEYNRPNPGIRLFITRVQDNKIYNISNKTIPGFEAKPGPLLLTGL